MLPRNKRVLGSPKDERIDPLRPLPKPKPDPKDGPPDPEDPKRGPLKPDGVPT